MSRYKVEKTYSLLTREVEFSGTSVGREATRKFALVELKNPLSFRADEASYIFSRPSGSAAGEVA